MQFTPAREGCNDLISKRFSRRLAQSAAQHGLRINNRLGFAVQPAYYIKINPNNTTASIISIDAPIVSPVMPAMRCIIK